MRNFKGEAAFFGTFVAYFKRTHPFYCRFFFGNFSWFFFPCLDGEDVMIESGTFSWTPEGPPCLKRYESKDENKILVVKSLESHREIPLFYWQNKCSCATRLPCCCGWTCGQWKVLFVVCYARWNREKKWPSHCQGTQLMFHGREIYS